MQNKTHIADSFSESESSISFLSAGLPDRDLSGLADFFPSGLPDLSERAGLTDFSERDFSEPDLCDPVGLLDDFLDPCSDPFLAGDERRDPGEDPREALDPALDPGEGVRDPLLALAGLPLPLLDLLDLAGLADLDLADPDFLDPAGLTLPDFDLGEPGEPDLA